MRLFTIPGGSLRYICVQMCEPEEAGKAIFNVATLTYATVTCTRHVQHTYYRIIYKQNPFNIISRGCKVAPRRIFG